MACPIRAFGRRPDRRGLNRTAAISLKRVAAPITFNKMTRLWPLLVRALLALVACALIAACARNAPPAPVHLKGQESFSRSASATPEPLRGVQLRRTKPEAAATQVVARGDTLYRIARRHRVALRALIERNRLRPPYWLELGQRLIIPRPGSHVVSKGDTLYSISRRYGVDVRALVQTNRLRRPYAIAIGQKLALPGSAPLASATPRSRNPEITSGGARRDQPHPDPIPQVHSRSQSRPGSTARLGAAPPQTGQAFLWPVRGRVILGYGPRKGGRHNDGINISARRGSPVRAAESGVVVYAGNELRGFGNLLLIRHAGGWMSAYAHNQRILVSRGDRVRRGQMVARVGSSGNVSKPQLHFELRRGARAVDPRTHLARLSVVPGALRKAADPGARLIPG